MRSILRIAITLMVATVILLLAACNQESGQATTAAEPTDAGVQRIGQDSSPNEEYFFVSSIGNLEYFTAHRFGWKIAGEYLGVKTTYVSKPDFDIPGMVTDFEQVLARNPAGIAFWGVDPVLHEAINRATELGIPTVSVIGDLPDSSRLGYVGSYQYNLGFLGGETLGEMLNGSGQVAILTLPGTAMFDEREQGFRDGIAQFPGIDVVARADTQADTVVGIEAAKSIMNRYPNLGGFFCTDSVGAISSATAVEEAGKTGEIQIIGMDRNADVLDKVQNGTITGTIAQNDVSMSLWALLILYTQNHFQPPLTSDNEAAGAVVAPEVIYMPPNYIDASNLQYYQEANELYATVN
jgi:ribose transport system substrate-binding protein